MNDKGISLVLVMGILVILGMVAVAFIVMSVTEMGVTSYIRDSKIAFHAADAGIDRLVAGLPDDVLPFPNPDSATWDTLSSVAIYKSGEPDTTPVGPEKAGETDIVGTDMSTWTRHDFRIVASGRRSKSQRTIQRTIEARVRFTLPTGTGY